MSAVSLKARVRALEARIGRGWHTIVIPPGTSDEDYEVLVEAGHAKLNFMGGGILLILNRGGNGLRGRGRSSESHERLDRPSLCPGSHSV